MRAPWLAVPALLLLVGCPQGLDPTAAYREAARKIRFSVERVEPSLQLALPLDQSRLVLRVTVGLENPTGTRLRARGFQGRLSLDDQGAGHPLGGVAFSQGIDLPAQGRATVPVDLAFTYRELKESWSPVSAAVKGRRATWRLEGNLDLEVMGFPFTVPVRASKGSGGSSHP